MKRIILFLAVNIAAVAMLTFVAALVCSLLGVDISELSGDADGMLPLLGFAFVFGMAGSLVSLFLSKKMVKASMRCRTIDGSEGDAERWLVDTIADLARRAGVKMPEVAIYPGDANAFATGAFKNSALVAVSTGIMEQMSREELRAVLGHEMSHVSNGDMVTMCLAQGVVNTFVIFFAHIIANVVQGALSGGKNRRGRGGYGLYHMIVQVAQLALGLLSSIVLLWYSRRREYAADAGSARLLGSPSPMIAALRRLGNLQPGVLPDSIKAFGIAGGKTSLFATHPSLEDRIAALMNLPPDTAA
ncbi:MAG: protease HtpX [Kiritimatiellae bacterium]|nr:protease HtpX [Kiritimatiellia bacterium]